MSTKIAQNSMELTLKMLTSGKVHLLHKSRFSKPPRSSKNLILRT